MFLFAFIFSSSQTVFAQSQSLEESAINHCPALFYAIIDDDMDVIRTLLEYGVDPNASLENCPPHKIKVLRGKGLLGFFSELYNYDYVDLPEGSTLLHLAAYMHYEYDDDYVVYNSLHQYGANNRSLDTNGYSPHRLRIGIPCLIQQSQISICLEGLGQFVLYNYHEANK